MISTMHAGQFGRRRPFDPYRPWCKLLLHCGDGQADGSTTFVDDGPLAKTVTVYGNAQVDTSQSALGGASAQFDGSGDGLSVPNGGDFDFGAGDFFVRFRLKSDILSAPNCAFIGAWGSGTDSWVLHKDATATNVSSYLSSNGTSWDVSSSGTSGITVTSMASFKEIAFGRKGTSFAFWLDGTYTNTAATSSATLKTGGTNLYIGINKDLNGAYVLGRIDEVHILKGICPVIPGNSYLVASSPFANAA